MPLGFKGNILTTSSAAADTTSTIVTIAGKSVGNSSGIYSTSFTIDQDPEGLVSGSAIGNSNGRYLPFDAGNYDIQIIAFGSTTHSASSSWGIGIGYYDAPNGIMYNGNTFTYASGTTMTTPSSTQSVVITSGGSTRGLVYRATGPGSVPSVTVKITAT